MSEGVKPDPIWHFWCGDARIHTKFEELILCFSYDPALYTKYIRESDLKSDIHCTMIKSDVNCQECLELIHA